MEEVSISPLTTHHKRKIMKGEPFRIKQMNGGAVMLLHKERMGKIHKAFRNGKGHTITLSEDELHANGGSIFGSRFDKTLEKHGVKKLAYKIGDQLKPIAKTAITAGLLGGAAGLSGLETFATGGAGASLVPAIGVGALGLSALANDYLDNPRKYQNTPQNQNKDNQIALNDLKSAGMTKVGQLGTNPYAQLNDYTGQSAGVLGQANGQLAVANSLNQQLSNAQGFAREALYTAPIISGGLNAPSVLESAQLQNPLRVNALIGTPTTPSIQAPNTTAPTLDMFGNPTGSGLRHIIKRHSMSHEIRGMGVKHRHGKLVEVGSIGIHGNLTRTPQALTPAPYSQNFVWSSTLPPAYKRFSATPAPPTTMF